MRILHIVDGIPPSLLGGAGRIALETAIALQARGHEVCILSAAPDPRAVPPIKGVEVRLLQALPTRFAHYRSVFSSRRAREVETIIHEWKPDLIHAHTIAWQCGYRWIARVASSTPIVMTLHDAMTVAYSKVTGNEQSMALAGWRQAGFFWNPPRNLMIQSSLQKVSQLLSVSDALKIFLTRCGLPPMQTLHNGIDTEFWQPAGSQQEARKALKLPLDVPLFMIAGRVGVAKGSKALDYALPQEAHLALAGKGDRSEFETSHSRVHVLGQLNDEQMRLLYTACDAVVVPSIYLDPFPTVCLEGMACARPVIATCFGGSSEAVLDGMTGWIVNPSDTSQLRMRLQWCISHPGEAAKMGERGRDHVRKQFAREKHIKELLEVYEACIRERKAV